MLTDTHCRNAKPRNRLYRLNDRDGLYLEVKPSAIKAFRFRFKIAGKESMLALGDYPMTSLAEAREKALLARKLVKQGISPVQQRIQEKSQLEIDSRNTFELVALEWLTTKDWEDITRKRRLDMLTRVVFPTLGKLSVRTITSQQVLLILQKTYNRGAPSVAREAKRTISSIFQFAVSTLRADSDPVWPIRQALPANKTQHKNALSKDQITQLLKQIGNHGGNFATIQAFMLMWYTLLRPGEVADAKWSEIDLEKRTWTIEASRMKARRAHSIYIVDQALEIFKAMRPVTGKTDFVFVGRDSNQKGLAIATFRSLIYKSGWKSIYSPHGTRTTGSTLLNEMGYRSDLIEAQLAHADPNQVRRTYNHTDYFDERAKMMQDWSNFIDKLKAEN
jgi:integrase